MAHVHTYTVGSLLQRHHIIVRSYAMSASLHAQNNMKQLKHTELGEIILCPLSTPSMAGSTRGYNSILGLTGQKMSYLCVLLERSMSCLCAQTILVPSVSTYLLVWLRKHYACAHQNMVMVNHWTAADTIKSNSPKNRDFDLQQFLFNS